MSLLLRYQSQATRDYNQSKKELERVIAERRHAEDVAPAPEAEAAADETETKVVMQNGFVSQNSSEPQTAPVSPIVDAPLKT